MRFLRASDIDTSPANADGTANNWRMVRAVRIGLLVRGPVGSAVDKSGSGGTKNVLGAGFTDSNDTGSGLTVSADGRLRQSLVFTVQLRNAQYAITRAVN